MERVGVHAQAGGQLVGGGRALGELVGQPELGDGGEHLGAGDPDRLVEHGRLRGHEPVGQCQQPLPEAQDAADGEGGWRAPRHGYAGTAERM